MTEPIRRPPLGLFPDRPQPRLYDRMVEVLRVRHYSKKTEEAYVRQLAEEGLNRFLTHLAVNEHVTASTENQAMAALLFLYQPVLEQPLDRIEGVVRARRLRRFRKPLPSRIRFDSLSSGTSQSS